MKPIAGSVVSSKPVSLSKATTILSRFVVSDTGADQDVSAFLRRTSEAFDELARFHRELGGRREGSARKIAEEVERRKDRKKKGEEEEAILEATQDGNVAAIEGRRKRRKKSKEVAAVEAAQDGNFAEIKGNPVTGAVRHGGGALDLGESKSGSRDKQRAAKEIKGRVGNVAEMENEMSDKAEVKRTKNEDVKEESEREGVVENHSHRRRKKKRKKEEDVEGGNGDGVENHVERHHKKKRKVKEES